MNIIDRQQLKHRIDAREPMVLLEALPERFYRAGHLPGALLFPHDQAEALAPAVVADKRAPIVVYCSNESCRNSHIAAAVLEKLGYSDVAVYTAGKQDWEQAGLPLEA